jgi:hypothetical protein
MNRGAVLTALGNADRDKLMRFGKLMHIALKGMPRLTHAQRKERPTNSVVTRGTHRRNAMAAWKPVAEGRIWNGALRYSVHLPDHSHRKLAQGLFSNAILSGVPEERAVGIAAIALT